MKITKVCCQGCGAALEVEESIRFVTCNYCQARLEIVHDLSVTHSRLLEEIDRRTSHLEGGMRVLQLQNQLEQLDREWDRRREELMVRGKSGRLYEPSAGTATIGGLIGIVIGVVFMVMASQLSGAFALFGLVFIGFAIAGMVSGTNRAETYESARISYERSRSKLLLEIREASSES